MDRCVAKLLVGLVLFAVAGCQSSTTAPQADVATAQASLDRAEELIYLKGSDSPATQLAFAESIAQFTSVLAGTPDDVEALLGRALAYTRTAQHQLAADDVARALELQPEHPMAHAYQGRIRYLRNDLQGALASFSQALTLDPGCVYALNNRGILWNKLGNAENAKADYEAAVAADPTYFKAHYNLGNIYKRSNEWAKAVAAYRKTVELNPNYTWAHHNLGNLLLQQNQLAEAGKCFETCIRVAPENADGYRGRGLVHAAVAAAHEKPELMKQGRTARTDAALADFDAALRFAPQEPQSYVGRAQVYDLCGRYEDAAQDLEKALQLDPTLVPAHALMARGLLKRGKYGAARQVYATLAKLESTNPLWSKLAASTEPQLIEFARMVDETERSQAEVAANPRPLAPR